MSMTNEWSDEHLPGLYHAANSASLAAQKENFRALLIYLVTLVIASLVPLCSPHSRWNAILTFVMFLAGLGILLYLKFNRPDDTWYNGRAVAESVKTRAWRWMMGAEPYLHADGEDVACKRFISDLKDILSQNRGLANKLPPKSTPCASITEMMKGVRLKPATERLELYKASRLQDQAQWYSRKSVFNRQRANLFFWMSVFLHTVALALLLSRIVYPELTLPIGSFTTAAGAILTWVSAKKYNELASSYSLAAHEISLIEQEAPRLLSNVSLSEFIVNTEAAFSREHTQWTARKSA